MNGAPARRGRADTDGRIVNRSATSSIAFNDAELREQAAASASRAIELVQTLGYTGDKG
jgi:hypothetical protein